ncbi:hypothetical protein Hanom_Chr16g01464781 [Helianthus anomalus]
MPFGDGDDVAAALMGADVFRRGDEDVVKKNNSDEWQLGQRFCFVRFSSISPY